MSDIEDPFARYVINYKVKSACFEIFLISKTPTT